MSLDLERLVPADVAAQWLGVSPQVIDYWRVSGKLKHSVKDGRSRLYLLGEVIECDRLMRDARPRGRLVNGRKPRLEPAGA